MLTDYHVHLRPDEPDTPPERYFTADNVERYRAAADGAAVAELGISEHVHRFRQALEVWRHPFWVEQATDDLDAYCEFLAASGLRVGIEADYVRGAEERIAELLGARRFDYVIGSVHFVGDGAVDHLGYDVWEIEGGDPDRVWSRYFEHLAGAARSGLFDTLAHPDLVKVWGVGKPARRRRPAALLRARGRGDRRVRRRRRGLDRRPAQAGRRALSGARLRRALRRGRASRSRSPPTPTCPSTSATPTIEAAGVHGIARDHGDLRLRGPQRRMEPLG